MIREERQSEFSEIYLNSKGKGILYLCPRFGKTAVAIKVMESFTDPRVLVLYPDKQIKQSWEEEMKRMGYFNSNITWSTHMSMHKHVKKFDIVIVDEIHLLSENQISYLQKMLLLNDKVLGLTGTLSSWTEKELSKSLGMNVLARYPIDTAIKEGIISDYQITIKTVALDNKVKNKYKSSTRTEKEQFDAYGSVIKRLEAVGGTTFHLRLARMRIIQNSISKTKATKELLKKFSLSRVLVFCGLIKTAESLGCPVHHSKSSSSQAFEKFAEGDGNHMAVVKIGNTGVTYKPLNKVIINYFDSNGENLAQKINRCMAMEYDNPEKKSDIWIISSDEDVELNWLSKALEFFDKSKIKFI